MARAVVFLPDFLAVADAAESADGSSHLTNLESILRWQRLEPLADGALSDYAALGLPPNRWPRRRGPLQAAYHRFERGRDAVYFRVDLVGVRDGVLESVGHIDDEENAAIWQELSRLQTRRLSVVCREGSTGVVAIDPGSLEVNIPEPKDLWGSRVDDCRPEGEDEFELRRFVDDSINLLHTLDFNKARLDQGKSTIGMAWPWDGDRMPDMPNLALRYGPGRIVAASNEWVGIARLVGWSGIKLPASQSELRWNASVALEVIREGAPTIVNLDAFRSLQARKLVDEAHWLHRRLDEEFFQELAKLHRDRACELLFVACSTDQPGLAATTHDWPDSGSGAFRMDAAHSDSLKMTNVWDCVARFLQPSREAEP